MSVVFRICTSVVCQCSSSYEIYWSPLIANSADVIVQFTCMAVKGIVTDPLCCVLVSQVMGDACCFCVCHVGACCWWSVQTLAG